MQIFKMKFEHQIRLIASLREFSGKVSSAYISQREFFITTLQSMSEHLLALKTDTLKEACEKFAEKLDQGAVPNELVTEFKCLLDALVSGRDFAVVGASLIGGKELIKMRISKLQPLSVVAEERKPAADRDKTADRLVTEAYKRLQFDTMETELKAHANDPKGDWLLSRARENVAEYCCLYQVPLRDEDTLTPFSLARIDAVVGACYRLLARSR